MITKKRILILWAVVIAAYGLLLVLTNPVVTVPREQKETIYADFLATAEEVPCEDLPEGIVARQYNMTTRNVQVVIRYMSVQKGDESVCERLKPWFR